MLSGIEMVGASGDGGPYSPSTKQVVINTFASLPKQPYFELSVYQSPHSDTFDLDAKPNTSNSFILTVRRTDRNHGWGQHLQIAWKVVSPPTEQKYAEGVAVVGPSGDGGVYSPAAKVIDIAVTCDLPREPRLECANAARPSYYVPDRFQFSLIVKSPRMFQIVVKRLDVNHGWGQNLIVNWSIYGPLDASRQEIGTVTSPPQESVELKDVQDSKEFESKRCARFKAIAASMCIRPEYMASSPQTSRIRYLVNKTIIGEPFSTFAAQFVQKAFQLSSIEQGKTFFGTGVGDLGRGCFYQAMMSCCRDLGPYKAEVLNRALREVYAVGDAFDMQIVCSMLARAEQECQARKINVYNMVLNRVRVPSEEAECIENNELQRHRAKLVSTLLEMIDEYKDKALKTVFLEPSRMYYTLACDHTMAGDVEVHGTNTYLHVLHVTLGVRCSQEPLLDDCVKGVAAFLEAGSLFVSALRDALWADENLGKSYEGVAQCRGYIPISRVPQNQLVCSGHCPSAIGDAILACSSQEQERLAPYLEQFARVFSAGVFLPRAFSRISQDDSLLASLQYVYRNSICRKRTEEQETDITGDEEPDDVRHWVWNLDDNTFDVHRACRLFGDIGVVELSGSKNINNRQRSRTCSLA